ncbi:UNVERIFIED_CONTAM: integrin subunit alpha 8 [Siphonaria sp. JEL0065]|nr:integrin subunit alpha 8 [Siphonaria sp. JEL0065]
MADFGGEFVLAHSMDLNSFVQLEWRVPTGDLVEIYKGLGYDVSVLELNACMSQGYLASQGIRITGRYLFPRWAQEAPPLIDVYYSYPHGGIESMSRSVASCWVWLLKSEFKNLEELPEECAGGIQGKSRKLLIQGDIEDGNLEDAALVSPRHVNHNSSLFQQVSLCTNNLRAQLTPHGNSGDFSINLKGLMWWTSFWNSVIKTASSPELELLQANQPTKLDRLRSIISEGASEMLSITAAWIFGPVCHSIKHIQSISKMNTFFTKSPDANLGHAITSGDFTGSGFPDLILAAPGYSHISSQIGCVFVMSNMSHEYLMKSVSQEVESVAAVKIFGPSSPTLSGARFGHAITVLDFNLDGIDDLVVSAPWASNDVGAVFVFYGDSNGGLGKRCLVDTSKETCVLYADMDADIVIYGTSKSSRTGMRGFGFTLTSGILSGTGRTLVVGSPYSGTSQSPNRGIVHAFESKRLQPASMTLENALWSLSAPIGIAFEEFGKSVEVLNGVVLVGAPGWRLTYYQQAYGMVYAYRVFPGMLAPILVGSTTANDTLTGFGSQMISGPLDDSGKQYLFISSPTESNLEALPKFLDLPGILTPFKSRGYSAGVVRIVDPASLLGGKRLLDSITLTSVKGSRSNARLGGSGWFLEHGELWVAEAFAEGETGKIHRIENSTIFLDESISTRNARRPPRHGHRHDPQYLADLFPQLECIQGAKSGDRFGVSIHRMDFDNDGGSDLLVATGTGLVHMFW